LTTGTCFSTRNAAILHQVKVAGDESSFQVTTMHDLGYTFDPLFVSTDLFGVSGLKFVVLEDDFQPQTYVSSKGISINIGKPQFNFLSNEISYLANIITTKIYMIRFLCYPPFNQIIVWIDQKMFSL